MSKLNKEGTDNGIRENARTNKERMEDVRMNKERMEDIRTDK